MGDGNWSVLADKRTARSTGCEPRELWESSLPGWDSEAVGREEWSVWANWELTPVFDGPYTHRVARKRRFFRGFLLAYPYPKVGERVRMEHSHFPFPTWSAVMTTTISKVLTVLVTALSLAFLGATAVSSIARTDWKAKANEYPRTKAQELQTQIDLLKKQAEEYAALTPKTISAIDIDQKSMIAKAEALKTYAAQLEAEDKKARQQNDATAVTAQEKLDVDKARREEVVRLQAQYEELLSQRIAAEDELLRLKDLLNQSRGVLERAVRRNQSLKTSLGRTDAKPYDPAVDEETLPPAKPRADGGSAVPGAVRPSVRPEDQPIPAVDPATADEEEMTEEMSEDTPLEDGSGDSPFGEPESDAEQTGAGDEPPDA